MLATHLGNSLAMDHVSNYFHFLFSSTTTSPPSQYSIDTVWPWLFFICLVVVQFLFHQLAKTLQETQAKRGKIQLRSGGSPLLFQLFHDGFANHHQSSLGLAVPFVVEGARL